LARVDAERVGAPWAVVAVAVASLRIDPAAESPCIHKLGPSISSLADLDTRLSQIDGAIAEMTKRGRSNGALDAINSQRRASAELGSTPSARLRC
jgi:hypothetical protein